MVGLGLLWGILSLTTEGCPEVHLEPEFDAQRYTGLWYEHARDKSISFERGNCQQARYGPIGSDGRLGVKNSQPKADGSFDTIEGYAECQGARCEVNFRWYIPSGDYRILDTDYDNYSIVYSCGKLLGVFRYQYVWVLGRAPTFSHWNTVNSTLAAQVPGYDSLYYTRQGGDCQYLPEESNQ